MRTTLVQLEQKREAISLASESTSSTQRRRTGTRSNNMKLPKRIRIYLSLVLHKTVLSLLNTHVSLQASWDLSDKSDTAIARVMIRATNKV